MSMFGTTTAHANIDWLTDDLATGGDFSYHAHVAQAQLEDLIAQHVGCVIDCRMEADDFDTWADVPEVRYHWLPTNDANGWHIPDEHFDAAVRIARRAQRDGKPVLAHCHMGINRGPSTAFAILLDRGMGAIEAFDLIRTKRPRAMVAYAVDALMAHQTREDGQVDWDEVNTFSAHYEAEISKVRKGIQHIMRSEHARRTRELFS